MSRDHYKEALRHQAWGLLEDRSLAADRRLVTRAARKRSKREVRRLLKETAF